MRKGCKVLSIKTTRETVSWNFYVKDDFNDGLKSSWCTQYKVLQHYCIYSNPPRAFCIAAPSETCRTVSLNSHENDITWKIHYLNIYMALEREQGNVKRTSCFPSYWRRKMPFEFNEKLFWIVVYEEQMLSKQIALWRGCPSAGDKRKGNFFNYKLKLWCPSLREIE